MIMHNDGNLYKIYIYSFFSGEMNYIMKKCRFVVIVFKCLGWCHSWYIVYVIFLDSLVYCENIMCS